MHSQITKKVVSQSLMDVGPIKLESHEHDASPSHDAEVNFPQQFFLFPPGPSSKGVEAMHILPTKDSSQTP
jgi:hypothetical protein